MLETAVKEKLTIIAVGSSAGGLEAIRELVSTLPVDLPVSYVVVQHMSPHHKSLMTELVGRQTSLQVKDVTDGIVPEPNVIYITPPNTDVIYDGTSLRLVDPSSEVASPKPSVDRFLLSLADKHGAKSMAIILSGTGTDGAYGVQAIREAGGITIAQDGETAKYDGMPTSAIQSGCVDLILSPQAIGTHLQKILTSPRDFDEFRKDNLEQSPNSDLLQILLARTRVDFRDYKQTTIGRRIERRMIALGIDTKEEYTRFCRDNPHAVDALFKDLLISVTRFFRDKPEFEHLERLIPELIVKCSGRQMRVWIAGCATGEEAYSIAMLLSEALGGPQVSLKDRVQIFATDIDKDAIQIARKGVYGLAALNDIPKKLADKYLVRQADSVRVVDSLRSAILFSDHNVCQDPPFQKVDLLCCRNLLIYFGNSLQQKVMARFHYAMTNSSLLFLGTAETVAGSDELFIPERHSSHIYRKRSIRRPEITPYSRVRANNQSRQLPSRDQTSDSGNSTDRQLFEALAKSLGKNSLLVTDDYSIARVYGDVSPYIEMNQTSSLKMHLDLLRRPLREEARSLITMALKNGEHRVGVRHLLANGDDAEVRLEAYPIVAKNINERAALLVIRETPIDFSKTVPASVEDGTGDPVSNHINLLENEVATTREALQQTIEELETSNEELQSLNEELQSTNEELQATNEELETSNEELQSTNEELITVNEELQVTAAELSGRTGELVSVLETTPLSILVLDTALQVSQATNAAVKMYGLSLPIASPHVSQCVLPENFPALAPICSEALHLGEPAEREFSSEGVRYKLSCSPFFDMKGQVLGITIVVSDFPGIVQELDVILNQTSFHIMNHTADGTIIRISEKMAESLGTTRADAEGKNYYDFVDPEHVPMLKDVDRQLIEGEPDSKRVQVAIATKHRGEKLLLTFGRFLHEGKDEKSPMIFVVGTDISDTGSIRDLAAVSLEDS
ncbi:chemotaxis protein CheB [Amaricoccus tamworthensis]|uniref:chemotaxis protein CheB n=1 Tax=Amaricoccus tamworthensis TaxID=57002 RepID=UPI003C7BA3D1